MTPVASLNPVAKLTILLALAIPATMANDFLTTGLLLAGTALVLAPLAGVNPVRALLKAWPVLVGALGAAWGVAVGSAQTGSPLLELGWLHVSTGSAMTAAAMLVRGLALALPALIVMATTDTSDLGDALAQVWRLPHRFVLGAVAALRVVGAMIEDGETLKLARRARGVGGAGSVLERLRANAGLTFALLVQVIRRGTRMALTMEARGLSTRPRTWLHESRLQGRDWAAMALAVLFAAGVVTGSAATGHLHIIWG